MSATVEVTRGGTVESVHRIHVAVVDGDGRLVARAGDPDRLTYYRSAAKPFQALPLVEDGAARASRAALAAVLLDVGVLTREGLEGLRPPVENTLGARVGELRADFELETELDAETT